MRSINIQKNLEIFYRFYLDMFDVFEHDFNIFNKLYSYVESKVNSSSNFNRSILALK